MRKFRLFIYYFLQMTWGIIQNALGFLIWLYVLLTGPKEERRFFYGALVTRWYNRASMSMGMFLFLGTDEERVIVHEYGHSIQSLLLGPFYLPVIGIPSFIWANSRHFIRERRKGRYHYTSFYPERWANHLGRRFTGRQPINY
ncbi:MAG: hypothetical protein K5908_06870 [Erysipelotrichaceae bacterium]|nr:hypothetical protein [Erysipelotrichaceae bacterium]